MEITSSAFEQNQSIPSKYTCDGENVSPPLAISGVPQQAKSFVLIMDDPDVPPEAGVSVFVHWIVYDIPPGTLQIDEGKNPPGTIGAGTRGRIGYSGPCPPDREHRYVFKLYALNNVLGLPEGSTREQVEKSMQGKVIASTKLVGKYKRKE
ncbi:MAG TPA: YbhB/YbcL family Raf kinase inhibitor-like protein [Patescibacteria group bacterium]|nr:YbhB/YbcL family Raf kinase inhibitor-like protein [Patescibacteria group bacterium]